METNEKIENILSLVSEIKVILDELHGEDPEKFDALAELLDSFKEEAEYAA